MWVPLELLFPWLSFWELFSYNGRGSSYGTDWPEIRDLNWIKELANSNPPPCLKINLIVPVCDNPQFGTYKKNIAN